MRQAATLAVVTALAMAAGASPAVAAKRTCAFKGFAPRLLAGELRVLRGAPGTEISCDRGTGYAYSLDPSLRRYARVLDPRRRTSASMVLSLRAVGCCTRNGCPGAVG